MRDFLRRVGLPSIIDATPATLRPPVHMTPAARLLLLVGRPLWAWRGALATLLLSQGVLRLEARPRGRPPLAGPPPRPRPGRAAARRPSLDAGAGAGGAPLGPAAVPPGARASPVDPGRPPRRPAQLQRPGAPSRRPPPHPGRRRPGRPGA